MLARAGSGWISSGLSAYLLDPRPWKGESKSSQLSIRHRANAVSFGTGYWCILTLGLLQRSAWLRVSVFQINYTLLEEDTGNVGGCSTKRRKDSKEMDSERTALTQAAGSA